MKTLTLDIETYSSIDLGKCCVYKYAESHDFEILLFGYSVDDSEQSAAAYSINAFWVIPLQ